MRVVSPERLDCLPQRHRERLPLAAGQRRFAFVLPVAAREGVAWEGGRIAGGDQGDQSTPSQGKQHWLGLRVMGLLRGSRNAQPGKMADIAVDQIPVHIGQVQVTANSRRPQQAVVEEIAQATYAVTNHGTDLNRAILAGEEAFDLALAGIGDGVDAGAVPAGKVEVPAVRGVPPELDCGVRRGDGLGQNDHIAYRVVAVFDLRDAEVGLGKNLALAHQAASVSAFNSSS
ncbi:hypothetical protein D3C81_1316100 [compost metagenome]